MMIQNEIKIKSIRFNSMRRLVIILHGYGNAGKDYIKHVNEDYANKIDDAIFLLPDAPKPCETWTGNQWFPLDLENMNCEDIRKGIESALPLITRYIENKSAEYKCDEICLIGISQGAIMALQMIYHLNISKIVAYCGMFLQRDNVIPVTTPDVLLIHSKNDKIIPFTYATKAKNDLCALGLSVELKTYMNTGHKVSQDGWRYGAEMLNRRW
ncbi:MAG: dienelactone hydrolase family protein [Alphaproteobacteria bacterium]|nr:dienelactone hydrolase family protein [Alphaproteobacteria bacterium]